MEIILNCRDPLTQLYSVTYMYYSFIGCFITILIGWTVSYFTSSESDLYDQTLIHPIARKMANYFPGKKRQYAEEEDRAAAGEDKGGRTVFPSPSITTLDSSGCNKRNGNVNAAFTQDVPMEQMEVYRTKL